MVRFCFEQCVTGFRCSHKYIFAELNPILGTKVKKLIQNFEKFRQNVCCRIVNCSVFVEICGTRANENHADWSFWQFRVLWQHKMVEKRTQINATSQGRGFHIELVIKIPTMIIPFVNLKSNSALLYNKGHNLLTSAFPPKLVKSIKFPLKS